MLAAVGHKCRVTRIWRGGRRGSLIRAGLSGRQNARVDSDTWQEFERKFKCSVLYLEAVIYTLPFAVLHLNQSASATHHNGMCFFNYFFECICTPKTGSWAIQGWLLLPLQMETDSIRQVCVHPETVWTTWMNQSQAAPSDAAVVRLSAAAPGPAGHRWLREDKSFLTADLCILVHSSKKWNLTYRLLVSFIHIGDTDSAVCIVAFLFSLAVIAVYKHHLAVGRTAQMSSCVKLTLLKLQCVHHPLSPPILPNLCN